jgi:CubicO group peptidase (beta-lactamase class C family)
MTAMTDGLISLDDYVYQYVPQWGADPVKSTITVRWLATHNSGIEDAEEGGLPHDLLTGWKSDFWKQLAVPATVYAFRDVAPVLSAPGTGQIYSNPGFAMLGYAVTAALKIRRIRTSVPCFRIAS